MKFKILQEDFVKGLAVALRFTSSKVQLPVLANTYLQVKKGLLLIKATNLEASVSISIGVKAEEEGEITVPSKTLFEIVSNLERGQIEVTTDKEKVKIESAGYKSNILGMNASDFPVVPENIDKSGIEVTTEVFKNSLSKTLFCTSVDETRPVLTGVMLKVDSNTATFVATDGFRLSQKVLKVSSSEEGRFIVPKSTLAEISRIFSEENSIKFSFKKTEKQLLFASNNAVVSSRVIEGEFPDYQRIIPKNPTITVEVDKEEFLRTVKLAGIFAKDSANVVKLRVQKGVLKLTSDSSKSGSQETKMDAKVEGLPEEDFVIAFNYRFLEEFSGSCLGESMVMKFTDANLSALFFDPTDKDYLHIIMPVRLQN